MHLKKILSDSNRKPNKTWVDQGSEFYNNTFKDFLKINNIGMYSNWSDEIFVISKIKNTVPWTYVIIDLNGGEITGSFYEKELQKTSQKKLG